MMDTEQPSPLVGMLRGAGQRQVMSDAEPFQLEPGQQYAMNNRGRLPVPGMDGLTSEIDNQAGGGFSRGAAQPGAGRGNVPATSQPTGPLSDVDYRNQHMQLQELKASVMRLGPMREKLIELGATPEQMSKMDAAQAYRFVKERSPGGMGQVSPGWQDRNQEFIDRIRSLQDQLTNSWQRGK